MIGKTKKNTQPGLKIGNTQRLKGFSTQKTNSRKKYTGSKKDSIVKISQGKRKVNTKEKSDRKKRGGGVWFYKAGFVKAGEGGSDRRK